MVSDSAVLPPLPTTSASQLKIDPELYPFASNYQAVNGQWMHYLDEGVEQAQTVLMVHGNPTWSFYYRNLVQALSNNFRCIVPDHIGCGLSAKPDDADYTYTLDQRIADLDRLIENLEVSSPIHLVVHDWGGMIGLGWARRHQSRIASLTVLNTAAFTNPKDQRLPFALKLARTPVGTVLVRGVNAFSRGAAKVAFKRPVSQAVRRGYVAPYDSWANRIATLRFVQDIPLTEADRAYATVQETEASLDFYQQRPVLIGWGLRDFVFDQVFLRRWQEILPQAKTHAYEDCGHYVLEDAKDRLVPTIVDFLKQHG